MGVSTRREFVITSAATVASLPAATYARVPGANDRIQIGMIGTSPYAISSLLLMALLREKDLHCQVSMVCDVFRPHLEMAVQKSSAQGVQDYRRILDNPSINAVMIATPDHWHATMALEAASAGKDIYLEAPMTRTWQEAIKVQEAVARNHLVFQCGAEFTSDDRFHQAAQIIKSGGIGKVLYAHSSFNRNSRVGFYNRRIGADVTRSNLDWKQWLGPAPTCEFDPERFSRWRKYWEYSGGSPTNLLFHSLATLLVALGVQRPVRICAGGGKYLPDPADVPDTFFSTIDYKDFSIQLTSCLGNEQSWPSSIYGHEGTIRLESLPSVIRERYFNTEYRQREEQGIYNVAKRARPDHVRNWLESLRTREQPVCHAELAESAMIAAQLGEIAYRENRTVLFDPDKKSIV